MPRRKNYDERMHIIGFIVFSRMHSALQGMTNKSHFENMGNIEKLNFDTNFDRL